MTSFYVVPAGAQTWNGATSNDWTVGSNWNGGAVPNGAAQVILNTFTGTPTTLGVTGPVIGATANLIVAVSATGNLAIQNGSTLTSTGLNLSLGINAPGRGTVTVTGAGSQWTLSGSQLNLGLSGNGTLNIQDNGRVIAQNGVSLGTNATASGTLTITSSGILETTFLTQAAGTGQANFDGGTLRARASNANFITGFTAGELSLLAGGLTIDTATFTVSTDATSGFSGIGGLTVTGGGVFSLLANSPYSGETQVQAGSTLALQGAGAIADSSKVVADGTFDVSGVAVAGTSIQSLAGSGAVALGTKTLTITNANDTFSGIISGTGGLTLSGGTTILTGANSYTGATNINAGTLRINGNQAGATGLTSVFAGGTLGGTGILGGGLTAFAGGTIAPGNSIGTLTINGNYTSNGGTLAVEAQLGGDASPADLLLINGNSLLGLAPTLVEVTNVGGLGGVTTNGIKIVDVAGVTSDAGVFVLNGLAIGGAYAYQLFQHDLATGTDGDWYLRSAGLAPTTPTFENYPVALLGMTELPTLRQRVGDRTEAANGVWSRIEGAAGHHQANSSSTGASYDSSLFLAQIGVEGALIDGDDGSLVAGFSAQYSRNSANVFSAYGNGSNVTEAMGIGATLTWRGAEGTYLDLQGQLARFWTDLDAIGYRLVTDNGGTGLAVSLEAGHEIALDDAWSITPQAQLSYAAVGFDSFTDRFGSMISLEAGNSLKGRVGVAVDYRSDLHDQDASASIGGVANLTYEFLDGATVAVSGTNLHYAAQKFGAELGLGSTLEWNGGAQALHAELLGATSFQGSYAVKGTLGFTAGF